jgi:hypothetical protein
MNETLTALQLINLLSDEQETKFPIILQSKVEQGLVVKFTSLNEGEVVKSVEGYPIGYFSNTWEIETFKNI